MKIIKNINIKTKLGILFSILCISIAVLSYKAVSTSEHNKQTLKVVHSKSQAVLALQDKIITPLYRLRELTQSLVMAPNKNIRRDIQESLKRHITSLDIAFTNLKKNDILIQWRKYKALISKTREYLNDAFEEGAYVNVTTESRKQFFFLVNKLLEHQTNSLNNSTTAYEKATQEAKDIKLEILTVIVLVLILATLIGWLIASNIISSIHLVQKGLSNFFEYLNHEKDEVKKIKINSKDEFFHMANMINSNVSTIQGNIKRDQELIKNATKVLEDLKGGTLSSRLTKQSNNEALNELRIMMNNMIDNLEHQIQDEIAKRIEQEQILIQQSKLASMGEMIGNIAHQWRQPLAEISAIHMNMKVTYDFDKFNKEYLKAKIKEANHLTNYMSQTISDFQNFFKPQKEKEEFSIQKACSDANFILQSSLKYHGINLECELVEDSIVLGYKNEYSQVILNILSNAKDVLLERKVLDPTIKMQIKTGDNYAIVKIQDNGGGVEEEILEKIFEPYFSTKHKTQGTGIGLYMTKNIIERNMNGFVNARNKDLGALFTVKVPRK